MNKILLALLLSAATSHAFDTVEFHGNALPQDQGWTQQGTVTPRIAKDALEINDQSPDSGAFFFRNVDKWIAESARAEGFALEIEALIPTETGPSSHRVEFSFDPHRIVLVLRADKAHQMIHALSAGEQPVSATQEIGDFVVWKIIWVPNGETPTFSLYCNGELIKSELKPLTGNANRLGFGASAEALQERTGCVLYKRITLRPLKEGENGK